MDAGRKAKESSVGIGRKPARETAPFLPPKGRRAFLPSRPTDRPTDHFPFNLRLLRKSCLLKGQKERYVCLVWSVAFSLSPPRAILLGGRALHSSIRFYIY